MKRTTVLLRHGIRAASKGAVTAVLCVTMVAPQAVEAAALAGPESGAGSSGGISAIPAESHTERLTGQEMVLQALNRFTFGPRPGDEAAVRRMGLTAWFEMQLHPERIDDSAFEEQMRAFPAMQLTQAELTQQFPGQQEIRRMESKDLVLPKDPVERAIYADAEATYQAQKKKQEAAVTTVAPGTSTGRTTATDGAKQGQSGEQASADASGPAMQAQVASDGEAAMQGAGTQATGIQEAAAPDAALKVDKKGKKGKHQTPITPMTAEQVEAVLALGPEQRFGAFVAMPPMESVAFRDGLNGRERSGLTEGLTPPETEAVEAMQSPERVVAAEALETRLLRDIESQRQLQAVMTDFWLNHFNVYVRKNQNEPYYLPAYERETILPNALGKFEDLLVATAESPAMLMYLDNWQSVGPNSVAAKRIEQVQRNYPNAKLAKKMPDGINENYGRELMELHTLGVGGGYTQKDVIEVAKCFTGWTIERPYGGGGHGGRYQQMQDSVPPGSFVFDENRHEPGPKVVLGHVIPEGGVNEGLEVLHILATSPATAHHISEQLAERFVSDTPSPALVDRMAATFLKSDGDIKAVLTTMFHSPEFWAPKNYRAKVKTPVEFLASAVRASGATVTDPLPLVQAMSRLGMPVYGMQTPNGYGWTADDWVSSNALISRMNFALVLSGGRVPGTTTNWPLLLGSAGSSGDVDDVASSPSAETEARLEMLLLGHPAALRTREAVLAEFSNPTAQKQAEESFNAPENGENGGFLRASFGRKGARGGFQAGQPETPLDTMAGLLLGSPDFQRR